MHAELRTVGNRPGHCSWIWFFRWGFGFWIFRTLFTIGHGTRSRVVTVEGSQ